MRMFLGVVVLNFAACIAVSAVAQLAWAEGAGAPAASPPSVSAGPSTRPAVPKPADVDEAIARGVRYLVQSQNPDGSWGTGTETRGTEILSMVPGSHDAFRIGTSALCVMALREAHETVAHDKGVQYLLHCADARRDDGELLYNTWAHIYVVHALSLELPHNSDPRIKVVIERNLKEMLAYATYMGGWAYYDFHYHTASAGGGPTSFGTAAGLVALRAARDAGMDVPDKLWKPALHRLEEMRLPTGMFLYGADYRYIPRLPANLPRGAFGRTQPANYALWLWDSKEVNPQRIRDGLDLFVKEHAFLEMGRKHLAPHESMYQTSGYYYYFDHYYAARLLETLKDDPARRKYADFITAGVLPHQEEDGSWWDFPMWDYHKPYGTAFAVLTLLRTR